MINHATGRQFRIGNKGLGSGGVPMRQANFEVNLPANNSGQPGGTINVHVFISETPPPF